MKFLNRLLRATGFQILSLMIGAPLITAILCTFISGYLLLLVIPLGLILFLLLYLGWHWAVATKGYNMLHDPKLMNLDLFKILFFFMLLYFIVSFISPFQESFHPVLRNVILLMNFVGAISFLYCIASIARLLNVIEEKGPVHFRDWIGDMILLIMFPVGIFFIQPRVNAIFKERPHQSTIS